MAYTATEARTKVRELVNESTGAFWDDTEIDGWISEGALDVSTKLLSAVTSDTITLITDQYIYRSNTYSWIGDCLRPKYVYYNGSSGPVGMQHVDPNVMGHIDRKSGKAKQYYFDSTYRAFYILPTPSVNENNDTVSVVYSYKTTDIADIIHEHQPLVWLFAASKAKLKERLYSEASVYWMQYINGINFERQDKYQIEQDTFSEFRNK